MSDEFADPFVLMILEYCMAKRIDIHCEQAMSDTLFYNLTTYFIPILSAHTKTFSFVNIDSQTKTDSTVSNGCVATGLSGGVDSLHTILGIKIFKIKNIELHMCFLQIVEPC